MATVIVIDKTDCIMKDNSMLILFQHLDCTYQSILCEGSHCFHLKSLKHDSVLHLTCIMSRICVSGKKVILEASWQVGLLIRPVRDGNESMGLLFLKKSQ